MPEELFDLSEEYESMLQKGISLSGEGSQYFVAGRIADLEKQLAGSTIRTILDFGCGIGAASAHLAHVFPRAQVVGVDLAEKAIQHARSTYASDRVSFHPLSHLRNLPPQFDLCYVNGVFHHIQPRDRPEAMALIRESLRPDGLAAIFENNPWNPGTRMVMSRIPFDRDAIPISPPEMRRMLAAAGLSPLRPMRYLFYFPRALAALRPAEPWLARLPLGAQYYQISTKLHTSGRDRR